MTVKEIIAKLDEISYPSLYSATRALKLKRSTRVERDHNVSRHKNFNIVTDVYEAEDGYVGITGIKSNSTKNHIHDINTLSAFAEEYKPVTVANIDDNNHVVYNTRYINKYRKYVKRA